MEHTGVTFVVVYSPPPTIQVISVQIEVDYKVNFKALKLLLAWCIYRGWFQTKTLAIELFYKSYSFGLEVLVCVGMLFVHTLPMGLSVDRWDTTLIPNGC